MLAVNFEDLPIKVKDTLHTNSKPAHRLRLAKGFIPMMPGDYLLTLYFLLGDKNEKIRTAAHESLKEFPLNTLSGIMELSNLPAVIDFFTNYFLEEAKIKNTRLYPEKVEVLKKIALNRHTSSESFLLLARFADNEELIDIVAANQKRLMECPKIYYALKSNPYVQKNLIEKLKFFMKVTMKIEEELSNEELADMPIKEVVSMIDKASDIIKEKLPTDIKEFCLQDTKEEGITKEEEKALSSKIASLPLHYKLLLALRGNRDTRPIMIKFNNVKVKRCVLFNPQITLAEVADIAKDKFQDSRIIRMISANREWTKHYIIRFNLCLNPKVSLDHGMKFLSSINKKDLVKIAHSKDVLPPIALRARKILEKK